VLYTCSSAPCTVPDLTFSEMTFLNPRQDKPQDIVNSTDQKKRRRKDQTIETEAEISRYFASAKARDVDATTARKERARSLEASRPHEKYRKRSEAEKFAYLDRSSLPPVELPERPFLGFGSVGGSLVSPVRRSEFPVSSPRQSYPIQRDLSPTRSTSYFSWAETRSPSHRLSRHRENESVPPVLPKGTPTVGDLVANSNIGQGIASGTPLSCEDNIMDKRDTRKRKTSYGRREDITTIPDNRVSNGPQEQILDPPRSISDLEQRQAKNVGPELVEKSKTPQYQQTPAAHGSNDHNAHTNPPLPELNDLKSKRPEDLINATLKLLLEKYGASTASPCAAVGIANETPKSPDAATNDNDPLVPTCHVPTLAKGGDGEVTEKDSSQGGVHGMIAPPRPFSRRTVPSKTQSIDKPSRHDYPFEDATMVSRDTEGAPKGSQATQGPQGSLNPSQHRRTDTKSAWNGYDAIYERQSISEELQYNPHGNQIRDDPAFNGDMMNHSTTTSDYELKDRYGSGFDDIYDDCSPDNRHRSNSYDIQLEAESYQGQVHSEGTRSQQLDEPYCYARPLEALEERFLDCGNGYLPKEEPPFGYNSPELGQTALSKDLFVKPQYATQDSSRSYLPIRGMLRDEPPRALYSRPHTQGSSHGSIQQNLVSFPDQIDNESLSGFWKPHRLY